MKLLLDCHSHSSHSFDAKDSMSEMCKRAMELGLAVYAITDHCECQGYYSADYYGKKPNKYEVFNFDEMTEASITEACEIKEKLAGRLNLICGVELGEATFDLAVAEKVVADKRLDYVIGSMHQIPNEKDFYFWEFNEGNAADTLDKYYKEIYKLCQWGKFDTLAHLTYPLIY
ncbi:MAG: PHP domain-containing protein [Oscillospiraceae bacterium]